MKWYHWILLPLFVVVGFAAYMLGRRNPVDIATEIQAFTARAEAKRLLADRSHAAAAAEIEQLYKDKIARLKYDQASHMAGLRDDPVALADWLARI